jgi:alpha-methylacyl-CoA racemase
VPVLPPALIADIAVGTYPAFVNVLLALRQREQTGRGCKLDIAMVDNLFTFLYWALGNGPLTGEWPVAGDGLLMGGSPKYQIYKTLDGKYLAAAPLEDKFWSNFIDAIGASKAFLKDGISANKATAAIQKSLGVALLPTGMSNSRGKSYAARLWQR